MYPVPSAFVQWTAKFVDPSAAFAYGFASWVGSGIGVANELSVSTEPDHSPREKS